MERAIRIGTGVHRAMVGITEREGIGQRERKRNLLFLEVPHRDVFLVLGPLRHAAVIPCVLTVFPGVMRAIGALRVVRAAVQMIGRQERASAALLLPHFSVVGHWNREPVAKAAYALERAEVVVERPILLHEDHHMFHVLDRSSGVIGGDRQRPANAWRKGCQRGGGESCARGGLQKITA